MRWGKGERGGGGGGGGEREDKTETERKSEKDGWADMAQTPARLSKHTLWSLYKLIQCRLTGLGSCMPPCTFL